MTRDDILNDLARSSWLREACQNIGGDLADDLYQEFWVVICSKSDEEICKIHADGFLKWWAIRILVRLYHGNGKQRFYRDFRKPSETLPEEIESEDDEYNEDEYQRQLGALNTANDMYSRVAHDHDRSDWYVGVLWEQYAKVRSIKQVARDSKINFREIQKIIQAMKDEIRRQYDRHNK